MLTTCRPLLPGDRAHIHTRHVKIMQPGTECWPLGGQGLFLGHQCLAPHGHSVKASWTEGWRAGLLASRKLAKSRPSTALDGGRVGPAEEQTAKPHPLPSRPLDRALPLCVCTTGSNNPLPPGLLCLSPTDAVTNFYKLSNLK